MFVPHWLSVSVWVLSLIDSRRRRAIWPSYKSCCTTQTMADYWAVRMMLMLMRGKRKRKERGCLLNRRIMDVQPTVSVCCGRVCSVFSLAGWVVIQQLTIAKERHKVEHKNITSKGVRQSSPPEYWEYSGRQVWASEQVSWVELMVDSFRWSIQRCTVTFLLLSFFTCFSGVVIIRRFCCCCWTFLL